jgi:toxin HigB-1
MELHFANRSLQAACTGERESNRLWGVDCARVVRRRLMQLAAAESLAVVAALKPARLTPLADPRDGAYAIDALPPIHIVFEPCHDPVPTLPNGGVDAARVTAIRILAVEE